MITVQILINAQVIYARTARNVSEPIEGRIPQICSYILDSGEKIRHLRADGAVVLAKKMLNHVKEPGI